MAGEAELRGSIGLIAHRAARQLTKIYGDSLEPVGLTINRFGLLAYLYGAKLDGRPWLSMRSLAEFTGLHPSALPRALKPLAMRGWIASMADPTDRRKRATSITVKGCAQLRRAVPFWRRAQMQTRQALGIGTTLALNDILDRTSTALMK
jgi:DNA-binding MarR family transcriptional regulator